MQLFTATKISKVPKQAATFTPPLELQGQQWKVGLLINCLSNGMGDLFLYNTMLGFELGVEK